MKPMEVKLLAQVLLPEAKLWLRRSTDSLDREVEQTVAACLMDLSVVGVKNIDAEDPLIQQAAKMYLKANFGYDDHAERWQLFYDNLKRFLSSSSAYTEEVKTDG